MLLQLVVEFFDFLSEGDTRGSLVIPNVLEETLDGDEALYISIFLLLVSRRLGIESMSVGVLYFFQGFLPSCCQGC